MITNNSYGLVMLEKEVKKNCIKWDTFYFDYGWMSKPSGCFLLQAVYKVVTVSSWDEVFNWISNTSKSIRQVQLILREAVYSFLTLQ